jgi:hypothetical protein
MGIDGTVHTPEWCAVILPGRVKRVCSSVKSGVLLRNSRVQVPRYFIYHIIGCIIVSHTILVQYLL